MIRRLRTLQEKSQQIAASRQLERPFLNIGCSPVRAMNSGADPVCLESTEMKRVLSASKNLSCVTSPVEIKTPEVPGMEKNSYESNLECSVKRLHSVIEEAADNENHTEMQSPSTLSPKRARMDVPVTRSADDNSKNEDSASLAVDLVVQGGPAQSTGFDTPKQDLTSLGRSLSASLGGINRSSSLSQLGSMCRATGMNRSGNSSPRWSCRRDNISKYIFSVCLMICDFLSQSCNLSGLSWLECLLWGVIIRS
jgi:hypothetical protein